jgi:hypothetical protein
MLWTESTVPGERGEIHRAVENRHEMTIGCREHLSRSVGTPRHRLAFRETTTVARQKPAVGNLKNQTKNNDKTRKNTPEYRFHRSINTPTAMAARMKGYPSEVTVIYRNSLRIKIL